MSAPEPVPGPGGGAEDDRPPQDDTAPREEPLHVRLRRAAFALACIPYPDRPLTDDQAAELVGAAHLLMTASARLEATEEHNSRSAVARRRRTRFAVAALVGFAVVYLLFITVVITLDASH